MECAKLVSSHLLKSFLFTSHAEKNPTPPLEMLVGRFDDISPKSYLLAFKFWNKQYKKYSYGGEHDIFEIATVSVKSMFSKFPGLILVIPEFSLTAPINCGDANCRKE